MKTTDKSMQVQTARLSEGMSLIFDQEASCSSSPSSSRSSSRSSGRSRSTCRDYRSSRTMRRSHRRRSRSRSSSRSSSSGSSRSRSHPRCHRQSSHHRCRRHCHSPPRRYRAHSRSFSPSPNRSHRKRHHGSSAYRRYRGRSRSYSRSPSSERYYRRRSHSRSRSPNHRRHRDFVGRYRNRLSDSPHRSPRSYRSRSRTPEQSSVRLSQDEKRELLKIAAKNAEKIVGSDRLVLPESVKNTLQPDEKASSSPHHSSPVLDKWVRQEPVHQQSPAQQVTDTASASEDGELSPKTSPKRKPIAFSINNSVAKPTHGKSLGMAEIKVTPRVDIVGSKKPYGQWVPVKTTVPDRKSVV